MEIIVKKLTEKEIEEKGIESWPFGKKKFRVSIGITILQNIARYWKEKYLLKQAMEQQKLMPAIL